MANSIFTRGQNDLRLSVDISQYLAPAERGEMTFGDVVVVIRAVEIEGETLGEPGKIEDGAPPVM